MYPPLLLIMEFERAFLIIIILLLLKSILHTSITTAMPECLLYLSISLHMYIQEASETEAPYNLRVYKCLCTYLNTFSSRQSARPKFANVSSILLLLLFSVFFSISMVDLYNFIPAAGWLGLLPSHAQVYSTRRSHTCLPQRKERWGGRTLAEERGHLNIHLQKNNAE